MVRKALTSSQRRAVKNEEAAIVLVESLNEKVGIQKAEIEGLRDNYADTQNKLQRMETNFHRADTLSRVLLAKAETLSVIEFVKIVLFGVLLGWGFLMLGQKAKSGVWFVVAAIIVYVVAVFLQKKTVSTKRKRVK